MAHNPMADPNFDKSQRSVFVGNIPYEATEEKLKEIFSEVGPVASFKLVYDRENGKPKGYGFCEFKDAETALSAMRNLNGYEIGGRTLRVDNACTEKSRMEMQSLMSGSQQQQPSSSSASAAAPMPPVSESPYGDPVDPEKAPESISKAVASLPPENMFELMKQMKMCIQNNPQEARVMLNQNPQLAYALLQAQVVMRIVDPELAVTMLHKASPRPPMYPNQPMQGINPIPNQQGGSFNPMPPHGSNLPPPQVMQRPGQMMDGPPPQPPFGGPPHGGMGGGNQFMQHEPRPPMRDPRDERFGGGRDPRSRDPRAGYGGGPSRMHPPTNMQPSPANRGPAQPSLPPHLAGADPEKAQLIMQVLKLTDEQIAMLPADQRESIMHLKKQINAVPH